MFLKLLKIIKNCNTETQQTNKQIKLKNKHTRAVTKKRMKMFQLTLSGEKMIYYKLFFFLLYLPSKYETQPKY